MRHALIADIHSHTENLTRVMRHIETETPDEIIILGDCLDSLISKSDAPAAADATTVEDVFPYDNALLDLVYPHKKVFGNQELRIRALLPDDHPDDRVRSILHAPETISLPGAAVIHGHQFDWINYNDMTWFPYITIKDLHKEKIIFYGHNHQNAMFRLKLEGDSLFYTSEAITSGALIKLNDKRRYLINVGDVRRKTPSWLLYDSFAQTVQYHILQFQPTSGYPD
jgi:predicted phosphodiesterase